MGHPLRRRARSARRCQQAHRFQGDGCEQQAGGDANDDDEVQMLGEQTWQERDAAAREAAVEIDD